MRAYHRLCVILTAAMLICSITINSAYASATKWYRVEMIVFSHLTPQTLNEEQWPFVKNENFKDRNFINLSHANSAAKYLQPYQLLPPSYFKLRNEAYKIKTAPGYQILMHIAWVQPIMNSRFKRPIHIYGGNAYSNNGNITAFNANQGIPYYQQANWQLDGTVNINVRHYFNVQFNLLFKEPIHTLNRLAKNNYFQDIHTGLVNFRLLQTRRMRSKELNYIDFPLYGILFNVVPLTG